MLSMRIAEVFGLTFSMRVCGTMAYKPEHPKSLYIFVHLPTWKPMIPYILQLPMLARDTLLTSPSLILTEGDC